MKQDFAHIMRRLLICIFVGATALLTSCGDHVSDEQRGCYKITVIGTDYEQSTYHYGTREEAGIVLTELIEATTSAGIEDFKTTIIEVNQSESECIAQDSIEGDIFDDIIITDEVAPQVYWEVVSSNTPAGSEVDFTAQYYTTLQHEGVTIDHSEVWYNITEVVNKTVRCPWITSFMISASTAEEKRASQFIKSYPHKEEYYSDSLRAYMFSSTFPVSATLAPFIWKPSKFEDEESTLVDSYFGLNFMQHFKDSLYEYLDTKDAVYHSYEDFRNLFVGLGLSEDFFEYTDSTYDATSGRYIYHFKWNAEHTDCPIPTEVTHLYNTITFAQLIHNNAEYYDIMYRRSYRLRAVMRVYDDRGVYGTTQPKDIDIK